MVYHPQFLPTTLPRIDTSGSAMEWPFASFTPGRCQQEKLRVGKRRAHIDIERLYFIITLVQMARMAKEIKEGEGSVLLWNGW